MLRIMFLNVRSHNQCFDWNFRVSDEEIHNVKTLLLEHEGIYSSGDTNLCHCSFVKHHTNLT